MRLVLSCLFLILLSAFCFANGASDLVLWFDSPATKFTQALSLGNGRLGAMVFGGVDEEKLVLNEGSLWSGSPQDGDRPDAAKYLPEIRRLPLEGKNVEAEKLVYEHFTCKGPGSGYASGKDVQYGSYQTLGNLRIKFSSNDGQVSDYRRELNLENAIARVEYRKGDVRYLQEAFVSAPAQVIVLHLSADKPGARIAVNHFGNTHDHSAGQLVKKNVLTGSSSWHKMRTQRSGGLIPVLALQIHFHRQAVYGSCPPVSRKALVDPTGIG